MLARLTDWLRDWWAARQRQVDLDVLWPACLKVAGGDAGEARAIFYLHASRDPAWERLEPLEMFRQISELK